jgi:hypothetical protein
VHEIRIRQAAFSSRKLTAATINLRIGAELRQDMSGRVRPVRIAAPPPDTSSNAV